MRPLGEELLSDQLGSDYTSNRDAAGMKNACCKPTWLAWHVDMFWRCSKRLEREISQTQRRAHDARKDRSHGVLHSMAALSKRLHRAQYAQAVEAWSISFRVNESAVKRCPVLAAKLVVAGHFAYPTLPGQTSKHRLIGLRFYYKAGSARPISLYRPFHFETSAHAVAWPRTSPWCKIECFWGCLLYTSDAADE